MKTTEINYRYVKDFFDFTHKTDSIIGVADPSLPFWLMSYKVAENQKAHKFKVIFEEGNISRSLCIYTDKYPFLWVWYWVLIRAEKTIEILDQSAVLILAMWLPLRQKNGLGSKLSLNNLRWIK
jgi:hypothetical protein